MIAIILFCFFISGFSKNGLFITLSFDDNLIEHYQAANLLDQYGMKGTFYVNSGRLSKSNIFMSVQQVQELQSRGHEIGGHTINHINLQSSSDFTRRKEVCDDKKNLENMNLTISSFAFPFGAEYYGADQLLMECGYVSGRDSGGLRTPTSCSGCPTFLQLPLTDLYNIRSISYRVSTGNSPIIDIINRGLIDVQKENKFGWIIFIFHEIGNLPNNPTSITYENLKLLVEYIYSLDNVAVVKTNQVLYNISYNDFFQENKINATSLHSSTEIINSTSSPISNTSDQNSTSPYLDTSATIGLSVSLGVLGVFIILGFASYVYSKPNGCTSARIFNDKLRYMFNSHKDEPQLDTIDVVNLESEIMKYIDEKTNPTDANLERQFELSSIIIR